jgi:hypothetical protein
MATGWRGKGGSSARRHPKGAEGARPPSESGDPSNMSIEASLVELERQHRDLEEQIAEARAHPSIDNLQIVELKRRKLLVKDEMVRLQN